jgi:SAM-dependent methyltransferase
VDCIKKTFCRLCKKSQLQEVLALTPTPPGNHFVNINQREITQTAYPLTLDFCHSCKHIQLGHVVAPEILYQRNYSYVSATSPVFVKHLTDYAADMMEQYPLRANDLVIDIGSNDGTALSFFQKAGLRVLGIDPATEIVANANKRNIPTLCEFFNLDVAKNIQLNMAKLN